MTIWFSCTKSLLRIVDGLPGVKSIRNMILGPDPEFRIFMGGLDGSGKTTILYRLKLGEVVTTIPTIGFNVESLSLPGAVIVVWDVGGRDKSRPLWRHYYPNTQGLVFVIDSSDTDRFEQARDLIVFLLSASKEHTEGKPLLVLCNKQDIPGALPPHEICKRIGLESICQGRPYFVTGTSPRHTGAYRGMEWLSAACQNNGIAPHLTNSVDTSEDSATESSNETDAVIEYGPTLTDGNQALERFQAIKQGTHCPFAKAAKLWGGVDHEGTLEEQGRANAPALTEFVRRSNAGEKLDGFCIEVNDQQAREGDPKAFGRCVKRLLTALSDEDPSGEAMMRVNYIGRRGWRFRFNRADFFITTFAPCYPETSSRFAFSSPGAFILLQPEESFARHDLPTDTPDTNWETPRTVRDRARVNYRNAGRGYFIPPTTKYPPAEHIVKPLDDNGTNVVRWWE